MIQVICTLPLPNLTTYLLSSKIQKVNKFFILVYELLEYKRTKRSPHVVLSSLMMACSEMRETLKIDVYNLLSRSVNTPRRDSRHYVRAT